MDWGVLRNCRKTEDTSGHMEGEIRAKKKQRPRPLGSLRKTPKDIKPDPNQSKEERGTLGYDEVIWLRNSIRSGTVTIYGLSASHQPHPPQTFISLSMHKWDQTA